MAERVSIKGSPARTLVTWPSVYDRHVALLLSWRVTTLLRSFSAVASVLLLVGAGGALAANVQGTIGKDRLTGTHGPDLILAGAGDDEIHAGRGGDQISGGPGSDRILERPRGGCGRHWSRRPPGQRDS